MEQTTERDNRDESDTPRDDLKVRLWGYRCQRCGHEWLPHRPKAGQPERPPRVCPRCKSPYWSTPRREKRTDEDG